MVYVFCGGSIHSSSSYGKSLSLPFTLPVCSFFRSFFRSLFQGGSYADNEHARRLERAGRYVWMASTGLWLD
jgi:hypothetical protein